MFHFVIVLLSINGILGVTGDIRDRLPDVGDPMAPTTEGSVTYDEQTEEKATTAEAKSTAAAAAEPTMAPPMPLRKRPSDDNSRGDAFDEEPKPNNIMVVSVDGQDIRLPPNIFAEGDPVLLYKSETSVVLPCEASGVPEPNYRWFKNGEPLDLNSREISISPIGGNLTIDPTLERHEGYYQCEAYNQYGTAVSTVTNARRALLMPYSQKDTILYNGVEGEPFVIPCQQTDSYPDPIYTWELAQHKEDDMPQTLQLDKRVTIDQKGYLRFSYLKKADERGGRLYKCNLFNSIVDLRVGGSYSQLNVETKNLTLKAPTLYHASETPMTALVGDRETRFKCFFAGNPAPSVNWTRVGAAFPSGKYYFDRDGTELILESMVDAYEGTYQCTGSNKVGTAQHVIHLKVESRPTFKPGFKPQNTNATEGDDVTFLCDGNSEPKSNINWYINGEAIDPQNPGRRRTLSPDMTKLTINDVCKDCGSSGDTDLVNFQCNISNIHGYVFASFYMNVLLPIVFVQKPASVIYNEDFDNVTFICHAKGDDSAVLKYRWYHDGVLIYPEKDRYVSENECTLKIGVANLTFAEISRYEGEYEVEVYDANNGLEWGSVRAAVSIVVPGSQRQVAAAAFPWWIVVVIAILLLMLIFILLCVIYIQRNRGDEYPVDEKERLNGNDPEKELREDGFQDYQRPVDSEKVKGSRASLSSTAKLDSEEASLYSYDMDMRFNEDGSFIGQYSTGRKKTAL